MDDSHADGQRLIAVGDIHGNLIQLEGLMRQLQDDGMTPERDSVVFLGDFVDSGTYSRQVVTLVREWQRAYPHWVFLKGNHEEMMLTALQAQSSMDHQFLNWYQQGGRETIQSYIDNFVSDEALEQPSDQLARAVIQEDDIRWLSDLRLYHESERHIFVHAGLRPGIPLEENDPHDLLWIRQDFIGSDYDWGKRVIYGHTPTDPPLVMPNKIGINTLPRTHGYLTAVDVTGAEPRFFHQG